MQMVNFVIKEKVIDQLFFFNAFNWILTTSYGNKFSLGFNGLACKLLKNKTSNIVKNTFFSSIFLLKSPLFGILFYTLSTLRNYFHNNPGENFLLYKISQISRLKLQLFY